MVEFLSKVVVAGNRVIASGSVVMPIAATLDITPVNTGPSPLLLRFSFVNNGLAPIEVRPTVVPNTSIVNLEVLNFDRPIGTTLVAPMEVGWIGNPRRRLTLLLSVSVVGVPQPISRTVHYTIMADGVADVE